MSVIVDERSAAFFALGAAQATGAPVAMLCTSGTAAANYHPAICEADESARAADRAHRRPAAGAARHRRRPDDRPDQALRVLGALVLRSRHPRGRRRRAAPLPLDRLPRAWPPRAASRARARSTSTCPGASRWRRSPVEGAVTATDPLALEGRDGRPLTAVTPIDLEPSAFLLDEVAGHIARRDLRRDRRRPPARPRAARAARRSSPRQPASRSSPSRPRSCAAARTTARTSSPPTTSCCATSTSANRSTPDLVLRFGEMPTSKPLRTWLAASGADQIVVDPRGGWNEPTRRAAAILRADPTELAAGWAARLERGRPRLRRSAGCEAERRRARGDRRRARRRRADHRAGPAPRARRRPPRRRPRLHRLEHADPRPGGLPAAERHRRRSSSATAAPTASTAWSPPASAPPRASGRPTTIVTGDLGLLHDLGGLAALRDVATPVRIVVIDNDGGGIFHFLPQAEALDGERVRGPARHPARRRRRQGRRPLRPAPPPPRVARRPPEALAAGTGLIEVQSTASATSSSTAASQRGILRRRSRRSARSRARKARSPRQQRQQRLQLDLGLVELGRRVRAGDDADAGVEMGLAVAEQGAAQADAELAVLGGVHPADRAGVPAAVHLLELGDRGDRRARGARRRRPVSGA